MGSCESTNATVTNETKVSSGAFGTTGDDALLITAIMANVYALAVFLCLYMCFHRKKRAWYYDNPLRRGFGPTPPTTAWGFVGLLRRKKLEELELHIGTDAFALLLFMHLVFSVARKFLLCSLPSALIFLVASIWIYPDGVFSRSTGLPLGELQRFNVGNLKKDDTVNDWELGAYYVAMVGSVASQYVLAFITFRALENAWIRMCDVRQRRMAEDQSATVYSMLIQDSGVSKHSVDLTKFWADIYPGQVASVRVVRDTQKLPSLMAQAFKMGNTIEQLQAKQERLTPLPLSEEEQNMSDRARDARDKQLASIEAKLETTITSHISTSDKATHLKLEVELPENDVGTSYFVLFRSRTAAATALQVCNAIAVPTVKVAPHPAEVCWDVLAPRSLVKANALKTKATISYYLLLIFWSIPILIVNQFTALDTLEQQIPLLRDLFCFLGSFIRNLIAAFLPTLALTIFNSKLPGLCLSFARGRQSADLAQVEVDATLNYWLFQFVWVLIGLAVNPMDIITNTPALEDIAQTMANSPTFLMNYLLIKFMIAMPLGTLSRVPKIVVDSILRRLNLLAPNVCKPEPLLYDRVWSETLLSSSLMMLFASVYPPLLIYVILHLVISYFLYGRSLLFSFSRGWLAGKVHSGKGLMWDAASKWLLIGMFFGQAFLALLHLAQQEVATAVLLLPLPIVTRIYHIRFKTKYSPLLQILPMNRCSAEDLKMQLIKEGESQKPPNQLFSDEVYVQPELCDSTWERLNAQRSAPKKPGDWEEPPPCLRVAVLGASGGIGTHVVRLLLKEGHTVVGLSRNTSDIQPAKHRRLIKFDVDLWDENASQSLKPYLKGCHFVISCLGSRRGEAKIVHRGTAELLPAMVAAGVPRMAMVSCIGVGDSGKQLQRMGVMGWVFSAMFATVLSGDKSDLLAAESECLTHQQGGAVSWVIVRAADLIDKNATGNYMVSTSEGQVGASVTREDLASFLVSLVLDKQYDGSTISLGGRIAGSKAQVPDKAKQAAQDKAPTKKPKETDAEADGGDLDSKIRDLEKRLAELQAARRQPAKVQEIHPSEEGSTQPDSGAGCVAPAANGEVATSPCASSTKASRASSENVRVPIFNWLDKVENNIAREEKVELLNGHAAPGQKRV